MNTTTFTPDQSWLHGSGTTSAGSAYDINTKLTYVAIGDYFWQGEEADNIISEIHQIWLTSDMTTEEAVSQYENMYL